MVKVYVNSYVAKMKGERMHTKQILNRMVKLFSDTKWENSLACGMFVLSVPLQC